VEKINCSWRGRRKKKVHYSLLTGSNRKSYSRKGRKKKGTILSERKRENKVLIGGGREEGGVSLALWTLERKVDKAKEGKKRLCTTVQTFGGREEKLLSFTRQWGGDRKGKRIGA